MDLTNAELKAWLEQCPTHTPEVIQELNGTFVVVFRPKETGNDQSLGLV